MRLTEHWQGVSLAPRGFESLSLYLFHSLSLSFSRFHPPVLSLFLRLSPLWIVPRHGLVIRPVINKRAVEREFPCVSLLSSFSLLFLRFSFAIPLPPAVFLSFYFSESFRPPDCDAIQTKLHPSHRLRRRAGRRISSPPSRRLDFVITWKKIIARKIHFKGDSSSFRFRRLITICRDWFFNYAY